jgi:hypothetical protein
MSKYFKKMGGIDVYSFFGDERTIVDSMLRIAENVRWDLRLERKREEERALLEVQRKRQMDRDKRERGKREKEKGGGGKKADGDGGGKEEL